MKFDYFVIGVGICFVILLLAILFLSPTEGRLSRKEKKKKEEEEAYKERRLQKAVGLEKTIAALHQEITEFKRKENQYEKDIAVEKLRNEKLAEKFKQERKWQEQGKGEVDVKTKELKTLKDALSKAQDQYAKEHAVNLKLERDLANGKREMEGLTEQRRSAEGESAQLKTKLEALRQEITHLKRDMSELQKKHNDTDWVAKAEYDRVARLLKEFNRSKEIKD